MTALRRAFLGLLLVLLAGASPARAAEPGAVFLRVYLQGDVTGRTELSIYKAYAGDAGPIFDVIPMPERDVDGYPRVEIETSGPIEAMREPGRIVIKSTGPGTGSVSVFVTDRGFSNTWQVHLGNSPGVGPVRVDMAAQFPAGTRVIRDRTKITLINHPHSAQTVPGSFTASGWHSDFEVPSTTGIVLDVAYKSTLAPLWLGQLGFGFGLFGLAVAGYAVWVIQRRKHA